MYKRQTRQTASKTMVKSSDEVPEASVNVNNAKKRKKPSYKKIAEANNDNGIDIGIVDTGNGTSLQESSTSSSSSNRSKKRRKDNTPSTSLTESHLLKSNSCFMVDKDSDKDDRLNKVDCIINEVINKAYTVNTEEKSNIDCTINEVINKAYTVNTEEKCNIKDSSPLPFIKIQDVYRSPHIKKQYNLGTKDCVNVTSLQETVFDHHKRCSTTSKRAVRKPQLESLSKETENKKLSQVNKKFLTIDTSQKSSAQELLVTNGNFPTLTTSKAPVQQLSVTNAEFKANESLQTSADEFVINDNETLHSPRTQNTSKEKLSPLTSNLSNSSSQFYNSDDSFSEPILIKKKVPFNIKINIGGNNQERKVEFSELANLTFVSDVTESTNFGSEYDPTDHYINSSDESDITTEHRRSVLKYYDYQDWAFDIREYFKIISLDDFLFNNVTVSAVCSLNSDLSTSNNFEENINIQGKTNSENVKETSTINQNFQFTIPTLLPVKRPPTRLKSKSTTSTFSAETSLDSESFVSKETFSTHSTEASEALVDDDAISLCSSWSIKTSDFQTSSKHESGEIEVPVEKPKVPPVKHATSTPIVADKVTSENLCELPDTSQNKYVSEWIENTQPRKFDFKSIPQIFRCLCYYGFSDDNCCKNVRCKRLHTINKYIKSDITRLNVAELDDAYKFAKDRVKLFLPLIECFINAYGRLNSVLQLVTMVGDVMMSHNTNRFFNVECIVETLQQNGYTFALSIGEIMMGHGVKDNIVLSDILLSIVFRRKEDLAVNWHLVKKLCHYRSSCPIDHTMVEDIIIYCSNRQDVELSRNVVTDIISCGLIDLSAINELLLTRFVSFLQYNYLWPEITLLRRQAKLNNVPIVTVSPKVWSDGHSPYVPSSNYDYRSHAQNHLAQNNEFSNFNTEQMRHFSPPPSVSFQDNFSPIQKPGLNIITDNVPTLTNCRIAPVDNEFDYEEPLPLIEAPFHNANTIGNTNGYLKANEINGSQSSTSSSNSLSNITSIGGKPKCTGDKLSSVHDENSSISNENGVLETSISENEVMALSEIIMNDKHEELITMYNKFKNTSLNNSFVLNINGFLKKKDAGSIYETISTLIETLEKQNSHFEYISNADSTLYLLALNTIVLLKQKKSYNQAGSLLFKFFGCLENLLKVKWFRSMHKHCLSEVGKFLYFCNIFTKGGFLNETLKILKSPDLKLLHPVGMWARQHTESYDNDYRNDVVNDFVHTALSQDLIIAKDIILHMVSSKDNVTELNVWAYYNELLLALLNNNNIKTIKEMLPNILQGWYKYLSKANMRGLLVQLVSAKLPEKLLLTFYGKCCNLKMYHKIKGNETNIVLQTDMTAEEIFIIIRYFLYKLMKKSYDVQEVTLVIKMPEKIHSQPKILVNSNFGKEGTKERILTVLACCFPTAINVQNNNEFKIVVKPDQIKLCVEYYRKFNCLPKSI